LYGSVFLIIKVLLLRKQVDKAIYTYDIMC
jgi:hypothetical protein